MGIAVCMLCQDDCLCHVDVVPAGDAKNWTYPPFEGVVADGKLFGRGAIDDKGPTLAAWLAMKMVKDAGIPLNKRVRMIIGSDEESGFRCVDRYFEKEEIAKELGFFDVVEKEGWGAIKSRDAGNLVKRAVEIAQLQLAEQKIKS